MKDLSIEVWTRTIQFIPYIHLDRKSQATYYTTLKSLALVSTFLRPVAQSALFSTIHIALSERKIEARLEGLLNLLASRPESAHWVKTLVCVGRKGDDEQVRHLLSSLFLQLPLLTTVRFSFFPITVRMIEHLYSLQCLQSVTVTEQETCGPLEGSAGDEVMAEIPHLTTLSISTADCPDKWCHPAVIKLASAPSLRYLTVGGATPNKVLLEAAKTPSNNLHRLLFLAIHDRLSSTPSFHKVAYLFSNLKSLRLDSQSPIPLDGFPDSTLQQLRAFDGPAVWAGIIVPGRPVEQLRVHWRRDPVLKETVAQLSMGSVKLRGLVMDCGRGPDWLQADIARLFPSLTRLDLNG